MALEPGSKLGAYEIVALLGRGGMGEVYQARDPKLRRDVAITVLPADVAQDGDPLARLHREAQMLAAVNHPHIAHIHGLEDSSGTPALVLELVEGSTLRLIDSKRPRRHTVSSRTNPCRGSSVVSKMSPRLRSTAVNCGE